MLDSINLKEKKILGLFTVKQDFELKRKYSTVEAFSGEITASGLNKLKNNPNVKGIYLNKKVHTMLQQSTPLINAPQVWNKQINGVSLTGAGQTVCVVDTGIDYKHPDIGNSQCSHSDWIVDGTPEAHNEYRAYSALEDTVYTITKPGFSNIAVHFSKIDVSKDEAYVFIEDQYGAKVQAFSGQYNDEWTFSVPGNTIKIHVVNYYGTSGYGFNVDKVVDGITRIDWSNCGDFLNGYDSANFDVEPMDDDGHGTHVSGIITSDHATYKGVAPDAKIVAFKALDNEGWGFDEAIIGSIDGCIRMADLYNISVISLSLGGDTPYSSSCDASSPYTPFIEKAVANNIMVVAASGNDYDSSNIVEPACVTKATPVGSVGDVSDQISSFSNRWSSSMLFAPGSSIYSTNSGGGFVSKQGTSMATPHVAGVAALIYQYADLKGITITPQEIEDLLIETGKPISGGYKRVDALAAINYLEGTNQHNITINEFLPNPTGFDNAAMPNGEWVELHNNGTIAVNLSGFVLYDLHDTNALYITDTNIAGDLVLQPDEYLVVYRDGDSDFSLNNDGDEVRLYDGYPVSASNLIDSVNYTGSTKDSSWSLIDGNWEQTIPTPGAENSYTAQNETGIVERVIDGDTLELETSERVRLTGIDTPEVGEYYYESAKNRLKELVEGKTVILERDVENKDMYDRLLRYIYINDSFVNLILVQEGYARAYPYPPNTKYENEFANAETEAKNNKLGIWNNASIIIPLKQGWNLISIPLNLTNNILPAPFSSIEGNYSCAFAYNGTWHSYCDGDPSDPDKYILPTMGIWINMINEDTLEVGGYEIPSITGSLRTGWSLIGYPYLESKNISEFLDNVTVYTYNNSQWYSYDSQKPSNLNTLNKFTPGYGYWIKNH